MKANTRAKYRRAGKNWGQKRNWSWLLCFSTTSFYVSNNAFVTERQLKAKFHHAGLRLASELDSVMEFGEIRLRYPAIQLASWSQTWFLTCRRPVRSCRSATSSWAISRAASELDSAWWAKFHYVIQLASI